jgi:hypothetical protein
MTKTVLGRAAALAAATMLALTACGGGEEAPEESPAAVEEIAEEAPAEEPAEDTEIAEEAAPSDAGGDEDVAAGAGEGAVVEIGAEFTDEETGDVITIVSAVRDMPTEYYESVDNPDGEMVYLEVSVAPGDTYGGVLSQSSFFIDSDGELANYAGTADDEVTAAGYQYFDGAPRSEGEATGYIPVYVGTTSDVLTGSYIREEMKVLGSDEVVPEFSAEFEIPAA